MLIRIIGQIHSLFFAKNPYEGVGELLIIFIKFDCLICISVFVKAIVSTVAFKNLYMVEEFQQPKEKPQTKELFGVIGIGIVFGLISVMLYYTVKKKV